MECEDTAKSPEILNWRGTVEVVNDDSFEALLWRNDDIDPGDNRKAIITYAILAADSLSKVRRGATFRCTTVIPPPPGEPIIQDLIFRDPSPLPKP